MYLFWKSVSKLYITNVILQFQDILRPNYNSVDLTEVELTDTADSEARGNDTELLFVSLNFNLKSQRQTELCVVV